MDENGGKEKYARVELLAAGDGFPDRGPLCPHCNTHIPQFENLSEIDEARVCELIRSGRNMIARAELRVVTGCPISWAKIWVLHRGRPASLWGVNPLALTAAGRVSDLMMGEEQTRTSYSSSECVMKKLLVRGVHH